MYDVLYNVSAEQCTNTKRYRRNIMKKTGIFIGALGICVVVALVVGVAGAAVSTPHLFGKTAENETIQGQGHGAPGDLIDKLEQQGVDVSAAKTAILNGDTAALKSWLDAYRTANPRNQTGNQERPVPEDIINKLEEKGVDVSAAKIAIQNGDMAALKSWLEEFRASHTGGIRGNKTGENPC
jgi:post-segregation antitoxin (ccd killing protein)